MIYARPTRLGSEKLFLAKEAPNRLFDSTLHHHVKKARMTTDGSTANQLSTPSLAKESSHPPLFQRVVSNDSDDFPGFLNTDEDISDRNLPYFKLPNFLIVLKQSLLPPNIVQILEHTH